MFRVPKQGKFRLPGKPTTMVPEPKYTFDEAIRFYIVDAFLQYFALTLESDIPLDFLGFWEDAAKK